MSAAWLSRGQTRHGEMYWLTNDNCVGHCLGRYGEYSPEEARLLCSLVPEGGCVLEAGANIGAITVPLAKKLGPSGMLVAIEPQRMSFMVLCANLMLNGLDNVRALNAAIGIEAGMATIPVWDHLKPGNYGGLELFAKDSRACESCSVWRADQFALPRLDLLKVDCEGMDSQVVSSAAGLIRAHRPVVYVEHNESIDDSEMREWLVSENYAGHWHIPRLYGAEPFIAGPDESPDVELVSVNMLFVPKERGFRVELAPVVDADWRTATNRPAP